MGMYQYLKIHKDLGVTDLVFIGLELSMGIIAVWFEVMGWSLIPIVIPMVAIAIHFSWIASRKPDLSASIEGIRLRIEGLHGEAVKEEDILEFYRRLKIDAQKFWVFWSLEYGRIENVEGYLKAETQLLKGNKKLKIRRLVDNTAVVGDALRKYQAMLEKKGIDSGQYEQRFSNILKDIEIGYSEYEKDGKQLRKALLVIGWKRKPKIAFYFDEWPPSRNHQPIVEAIESLFDSYWKLSENESIKDLSDEKVEEQNSPR